MKVEIGKKYRTRDGKPVRVLATDVSNGFYPVVAVINSEGVESAETFTVDGHYLANTNIDEHDLDLVEVKPKIEGWVNIYQTDDGTYYTSATIHSMREDALAVKRVFDTKVAMLPISFTIGEGLEDVGGGC